MKLIRNIKHLMFYIADQYYDYRVNQLIRALERGELNQDEFMNKYHKLFK